MPEWLDCPKCGRRATVAAYDRDGCPWCGNERTQVPPASNERARCAGLAEHLAASARDSRDHVSDGAMMWLLERFAGECALLAKACRDGWDRERFERELAALPLPGN